MQILLHKMCKFFGRLFNTKRYQFYKKRQDRFAADIAAMRRTNLYLGDRHDWMNG